MESGDSMVYPLVVEGDDGNLMFDRKEGRSQGIKFPTDEIAQWFAENYNCNLIVEDLINVSNIFAP